MAQRIGEILVAARACTGAAVREALQNQAIFGGRLGTNLLEIGAVTEQALADALGKKHHAPALSGDLRVEEAAVALLKPEIADRHDVVPYLLAGRSLAVIAVDPGDLGMLDEVAFASGKNVHALVAPEARVWALLRNAYGIERHLRGIDVDFGSIRHEPGAEAAPGEAAPALVPAPRRGPGDLMDEAEFARMYERPGLPGMPPAEVPSAPSASPPSAPAAPPVVASPPPRGAVKAAASLSPREAAEEPGFARPRAEAKPEPSTSGRGEVPAAPPPPDEEILELTEDLLEPAPPASDFLTTLAAALASAPGHAPPAQRTPPPFPPRPAPEPEPTPLDFGEAVRALAGVTDRNAIAHTVLRYARSRFKRAVLLTVNRGFAQGWAGLGEGLGPARVRALRLPLGQPGVLDTVVRTQAHFLGPLPKTTENVRLLKQLGGGVPQNAFLVPILALGRVVNVFYGDAGRGGMVDPAGISELIVLATRIAQSYDALVRRVV
jgi:hypothetical protein